MAFVKNVSFMYAGIVFYYFVTIVSAAIYIRSFGTDGYAIIGIVGTFFIILSRFDFPYFLGFIKKAGRSQSRQKRALVFSTMYTFTIISNLGLFLILIPVIRMMTGLYSRPELFMFYIIGLVAFLIGRTNRMLKSFYRANSKEKIVQKGIVAMFTMAFVSSIIMIYILDYGVMSFFIGTVVGAIFEFIILAKPSFTNLKFRFSLPLFKEILRDCSINQYISQLLSTVLIFGGFMASTFILDSRSIGLLTVILSLSRKFKEGLMPIWKHLSPVISVFYVKNKEKMIALIGSITSLIFILNTLLLLFLITIGEGLYYLYLGSAMEGTYMLFLLVMVGQLVFSISVPMDVFIFVQHIRLHNKILLVTVGIYLLLFTLLIFRLGILGVIITYAVSSVLKSAFSLIIGHRLTAAPVRRYFDIALPFFFFLLIGAVLVITGTSIQIYLASGLFILLATGFVLILRKRIFGYVKQITEF